MMIDYDSPCSQCEKCYLSDNELDADCREGAPDDFFMSEWGCYHYKAKKEYRTKGDRGWSSDL